MILLNIKFLMASLLAAILFFSWPTPAHDWRLHLAAWFGVLLCFSYAISGLIVLVKDWKHRARIHKARRANELHGTARFSRISDLEDF